MNKKYGLLFLFLISNLLLVIPNPVKATSYFPYVDLKNDVIVTNTIDWYYSSYSKTGITTPYIDIENITLVLDDSYYVGDIVNIYVKNFSGAGIRTLHFEVNLVINTTDKLQINASYYAGGWSARLNYWINQEVIWYQGMIVDLPKYNQIQITHSNRLAVPYEITARAIEIVNNTGSIFLLIPPFYVDFYPNAYWLATPPAPPANDTRGTGADYTTIYIGLAVIGGSLVLVYVYTYQTSCDRPKNKMKAKCQGIKPKGDKQ